jgi:hypothetical protein
MISKVDGFGDTICTKTEKDLVDIEKLNQEHYLYIQRLHLI